MKLLTILSNAQIVKLVPIIQMVMLVIKIQHFNTMVEVPFKLNGILITKNLVTSSMVTKHY